MKKLSVIVPVYNADKYLERCIESIRRSYDCENMELILINDGSTDKSSDICDTYRKYPDVVVFHKENGGVASARNLGIDNAKGEFITFCDADDWVSEEILSSVSLMEQHNYDLEVSGYMKCWTDGKNEVVHLSQEGDFEHLPAEYFISGHLHPCWGKIYKKSIIDQYHIRFPKHSLSEDSLFNIEYLEKCEKIYLSKRSYYHYLQDNSESLTKRINLDAFEIYILLQKKLEHYLVTKNYSNIEEILYQTLYPQYYNHIIKILYGKTQTYFEKKKLLNVGMDNREVQKTFQSVKNLSKGEKIICWLLLKKMYFGATTVLYGIGRKNRG